MTELEEKIWAAVFAKVLCDERAFNHRYNQPDREVSGFMCAEVADEAVEKFREAVSCEDAKYLLLIQEKTYE